jgi:hypothetical protein
MESRFEDATGRLRVGFSTLASQTLALHQQLHFWQNERGGVLVASSVGARDGVVEVVRVTPPHRDDRAGRYWLKLDHARVLKEIQGAFKLGLHFVGYWHTHPQVRPKLSSQDVAAMMPAIQGADLDLQRLLMVVVGGRRGALALDVCAVDCATGAWDRLRPQTASRSGVVALDIDEGGLG